jgi:hypothetical protein
MTDAERAEHLENLLATFLKPIRGIPFPVVIKALCETAVLPIKRDDPKDAEFVDLLAKAAKRVGEVVGAKPIRRPRPNEVGNDIEPFVLDALAHVGLEASRPKSKEGRGQGVGYPDILVRDLQGGPVYIEVKSFAEGVPHTTMRSFYLSPSANPKVCFDARHIVIGFGVTAEGIGNGGDKHYRPTSYTLIDLFELECDVKYEFNSDNRRMYADNLVLAHGTM